MRREWPGSSGLALKARGCFGRLEAADEVSRPLQVGILNADAMRRWVQNPHLDDDEDDDNCDNNNSSSVLVPFIVKRGQSDAVKQGPRSPPVAELKTCWPLTRAKTPMQIWAFNLFAGVAARGHRLEPNKRCVEKY